MHFMLLLWIWLIPGVYGRADAVHIPAKNDSLWQYNVQLLMKDPLEAGGDKSDNIILLLYTADKESTPTHLIGTDGYTFKESTPVKSFSLNSPERSKTTILVLLEAGADMNRQELAERVKKHFDSIDLYRRQHDLKKLNELLGGARLIGISWYKLKESGKNQYSEFSGIHSGNRYLYQLYIGMRPAPASTSE